MKGYCWEGDSVTSSVSDIIRPVVPCLALSTLRPTYTRRSAHQFHFHKSSPPTSPTSPPIPPTTSLPPLDTVLQTNVSPPPELQWRRYNPLMMLKPEFFFLLCIWPSEKITVASAKDLFQHQKEVQPKKDAIGRS